MDLLDKNKNQLPQTRVKIKCLVINLSIGFGSIVGENTSCFEYMSTPSYMKVGFTLMYRLTAKESTSCFRYSPLHESGPSYEWEDSYIQNVIYPL